MLSLRFAFPTQIIHLETSPDKQQPVFDYLKYTRTREKIIDDYLIKMCLRLVKGSGKSDDPFTN